MIAAARSSIRLGTTVTGLLSRDPRKLACEAVSLDNLSKGQVTLGVALGDPGDRGVQSDEPAAGRSRAERMDDRLDPLLAILSGESVEMRGADRALTSVSFRPASRQRSRLPVWVGGSAQAGSVTRRAARADGIVPYKSTDASRWSDFTEDLVRELAADVAAERHERHCEFDVVVGGRRRLPDLEQERAAVRAAADSGATWWLEFVPPGPLSDMRRAVANGQLRA